MAPAPAATSTVAPNRETTFTITSLPRSEAGVKTLRRLMRLQPTIQAGLKRLAKRRDRVDNDRHRRGGRIWTSRARATYLVNPAVGESFTIHVTPQLVPDIRSVERYLKSS